MLDQHECIPALSIRKSVGANCSAELFPRAPAARPDPELERRFVVTHVYLIRRLAPLTLQGLVLAVHVIRNVMSRKGVRSTLEEFRRVSL